MEKLKNILVSLLHIAVIASILLFIVIGLDIIGLIDMPSFDSLFGGDGKISTQNGTDELGFLPDTNESPDYIITRTDLNSENVKKILESVSVLENYSHDLQYTVYSTAASVTKRVVIIEEQDISVAYFISSDGNATRQIVRNESETTVNTLINGELKSVTYPNGNFDFEGETGAIITHEDFFDAADNENYTFSLASSDNGTLLIIDFTSSVGNYSQTQKYSLNLNYGVVTEASCYENGRLIYSLSTNSISDQNDIALSIPESFLEFENAASLTTNNQSEKE